MRWMDVREFFSVLSRKRTSREEQLAAALDEQGDRTLDRLLRRTSDTVGSFSRMHETPNGASHTSAGDARASPSHIVDGRYHSASSASGAEASAPSSSRRSSTIEDLHGAGAWRSWPCRWWSTTASGTRSASPPSRGRSAGSITRTSSNVRQGASVSPSSPWSWWTARRSATSIGDEARAHYERTLRWLIGVADAAGTRTSPTMAPSSKPQNILVTRVVFAKAVVDFGLSWLLVDDRAHGRSGS